MKSLPDKVDVHAVGDILVFSSDDYFSLKKVVQQIMQEGGKVVRQPTRFSTQWLATIIKPDAVKFYSVSSAVSVTDTGTESFIVYRWIDGKPERITLGEYPDLPVDRGPLNR